MCPDLSGTRSCFAGRTRFLGLVLSFIFSLPSSRHKQTGVTFGSKHVACEKGLRRAKFASILTLQIQLTSWAPNHRLSPPPNTCDLVPNQSNGRTWSPSSVLHNARPRCVSVCWNGGRPCCSLRRSVEGKRIQMRCLGGLPVDLPVTLIYNVLLIVCNCVTFFVKKMFNKMLIKSSSMKNYEDMTNTIMKRYANDMS